MGRGFGSWTEYNDFLGRRRKRKGNQLRFDWELPDGSAFGPKLIDVPRRKSEPLDGPNKVGGIEEWIGTTEIPGYSAERLVARGFRSYPEYRRHLVTRRGFESMGEYHRYLSIRKKYVRCLLDHMPNISYYGYDMLSLSLPLGKEEPLVVQFDPSQEFVPEFAGRDLREHIGICSRVARVTRKVKYGFSWRGGDLNSYDGSMVVKPLNLESAAFLYAYRVVLQRELP